MLVHNFSQSKHLVVFKTDKLVADEIEIKFTDELNVNLLQLNSLEIQFHLSKLLNIPLPVRTDSVQFKQQQKPSFTIEQSLKELERDEISPHIFGFNSISPSIFEDYLSKANAGDAGAMNVVAFLYLKGYGVDDPDNKKANEWAAKAALRGYRNFPETISAYNTRDPNELWKKKENPICLLAYLEDFAIPSQIKELEEAAISKTSKMNSFVRFLLKYNQRDYLQAMYNINFQDMSTEELKKFKDMEEIFEHKGFLTCYFFNNKN